MGAAPITRIVTPPSPALTGTSLVVTEDDGARFAWLDLPFTSLVWPVGELPVLGTNAERLTVVDRTADTFTVERGDPPVAIAAALQLAALNDVTVYSIGETATLTAQFAVDDPGPFHVDVCEPSGAVASYGSATGVTDTAGLVVYEFDPAQGGVWSYRCWSNLEVKAEREVFVRFSEALGL